MTKDLKTTNYWFKRRRYGWGFVPVTQQGWLVVIVFLAVVAIDTIITDGTDQNTRFAIILIADFVFFLGTMFLKSPTPHWRWGKKSTDNHDEDF